MNRIEGTEFVITLRNTLWPAYRRKLTFFKLGMFLNRSHFQQNNLKHTLFYHSRLLNKNRIFFFFLSQ